MRCVRQQEALESQDLAGRRNAETKALLRHRRGCEKGAKKRWKAKSGQGGGRTGGKEEQRQVNTRYPHDVILRCGTGFFAVVCTDC